MSNLDFLIFVYLLFVESVSCGVCFSRLSDILGNDLTSRLLCRMFLELQYLLPQRVYKGKWNSVVFPKCLYRYRDCWRSMLRPEVIYFFIYFALIVISYMKWVLFLFVLFCVLESIILYSNFDVKSSHNHNKKVLYFKNKMWERHFKNTFWTRSPYSLIRWFIFDYWYCKQYIIRRIKTFV